MGALLLNFLLCTTAEFQEFVLHGMSAPTVTPFPRPKVGHKHSQTAVFNVISPTCNCDVSVSSHTDQK